MSAVISSTGVVLSSLRNSRAVVQPARPAPMMMVGDAYFENLTPASVDALLTELKGNAP